MTNITYIGMDVHTTNYTLCAFSMEGKKAFGRTTINPDIKELVKYLETLNKQLGGTAEFECGYEAGCLGYTLYHALTARGYKCVILAPNTMPSTAKEIKTDKRDALKIAKCLAYGTYSPVHVPTDQDNAINEYIRMRDDAQTMWKQTKQQINALCLRHEKIYEGRSRWTPKHMQWLRSRHMWAADISGCQSTRRSRRYTNSGRRLLNCGGRMRFSSVRARSRHLFVLEKMILTLIIILF